LREKKVGGFSFGPLEYQKISNFQKKYKNTYRRVAQKKGQFCTLYIYVITMKKVKIHKL